MKQFTMSMYASEKDLYKAKAEHLQLCIDWALRANKEGIRKPLENLPSARSLKQWKERMRSASR